MVQLYHCPGLPGFGDLPAPQKRIVCTVKFLTLKTAVMVGEAVLTRTAEKVTGYIEKHVRLTGAERRGEILELFDKMHQVFPHWAIMTCPMMHPDILYTSPNCSGVFGYNNEYLIRNSGIERYFAHVHDADQDDLHACFSFVHYQMETVPPEEHCANRHVFHYRFKKPNSQHMYLHDEKATLHLSGAGNLYYVLFRDITAERSFSGVKVELFRQEQTLVKIKEYKPSCEGRLLTKREQELVALIRQGLSSKEIAWHLKISGNTVRNIKSKLFEKYNVNSSIELLNMVG